MAAQTGPGLIDRPATRRDSTEARYRLEEAVLRNPSDSRSVYWLARLTTAPDSVITLYRRYVSLEPADAWGWMPLGDALLSKGQVAAAESAWAEAVRLEPRDPEVIDGRARFDGEVGRYWIRAGRPRRAASALERSLTTRADQAPVRSRLALAQALTRPAVEPGGGHRRDSDGNYTWLSSLRADLLTADGLRLGAGGALLRTGNDLQSISTQQGELYGQARPGAATRLSFAAGLARTDAGTPQRWTTATGMARFRWTAQHQGPIVELAAQRLPLLATPELAVNQVVRNEARGLLDLPVGPIRLRGQGRAGQIEAPGETNLRVALDGAVVLPLGAPNELSLQAHRLGYRDTTALGYFAPERVTTLELGSYFELGDAAPWSLALDLGAGLQQIQPAGTPAGDWGGTLRGWGWIAYALGPVRALQLELEGSTAPGAAVVATTPDWRYVSLSLSLRWSL